MGRVSSDPKSRRLLQAVGCAGQLALAVSAIGCAQVLGIPDDPRLVAASGSEPVDTNSEALPVQPTALPDAGAGAAFDDPPVQLSNPTRDGTSADGILPAEIVTRDEAETELGVPVTRAPDPARVAADAGALDAATLARPDAAPEVECEGGFARVPIDIVFIVDNSGSMAAEDAAFEAALPRFVERLGADGVDERIILLSRHRRAERESSEEASTSVCIAGPVSGLEACPSERPALGPRFFPYSIKIDSSDSLERTLQAFSEPDPFGLTLVGWSEWLRLGARKVFIEITDADASLPSEQFTGALAAAAPEQFASGGEPLGFVFHSIVAVAQKFLALDLYGPDEPIQLGACAGGAADGPGQVYQELSRATGGLRQSICPVDALGLRLQVLAADVSRRSVVPCGG